MPDIRRQSITADTAWQDVFLPKRSRDYALKG